MSFSNQRQFARLSVSDDTLAYDETGRKLGQVTMVGGGGMAIRIADASLKFTPGDRLKITVVESAGDNRNTVQATVVYLHGDTLGLEFV